MRFSPLQLPHFYSRLQHHLLPRLSASHLRASQSGPHPQPCLPASNLILTHLGHPSRGGLRQFTSPSAYQGIPTGTWARIVFLRVLAGFSTQLWHVKAPAISFVPKSPSQETRSSTKLDSFTHIFSHAQTHDPHPPTLIILLYGNFGLWGKTFYSSIIPTNSNFFNYLIFLALSSSSSSHQHSLTLFPDGQVSSTNVDRDKKETVLPIYTPSC